MNNVVTRHSLDELWLHVTNRCNLECSHCLFACSPRGDGPGNLNLEECKMNIHQARTQGLKALYITGGEPLLWPHLFELLEWYCDGDVVLPFTILTNGTLINREVACKLSAFTAHGLNLRISLECYTKANNEEYRGLDSFERALEGIRSLNFFGVRPWVAYVNKSGGSLDKRSAESLEADFDSRLREDFGLEISGLKIIAAYSKGRFDGCVKSKVCPEQIKNRIESVQCAYGAAVSKLGVVPCPVLTDLPQAVCAKDCIDLVGQAVSVDYSFCASCFATGTSCGQ